jgi:hypothetical protein
LEWEGLNGEFNTKNVDHVGTSRRKGSIATNIPIGNETRSTDNG